MSAAAPARSADPLGRARARFERAAGRAAAGEYAAAARDYRCVLEDLGPARAATAATAPGRVSTLLALAELEQTRGRFAEAEDLACQAGAIAERVSGEARRARASDEVCADWRRVERRARLQRATAVRAQARYSEAERIYRGALGDAERDVGAADPEVASACVGLGVLCKYTGRYPEARAHYERAREIHERAEPRDERALSTLIYNQAGLAHAEARFEQALAPCLEALALRERRVGSRHPEMALHHCQLAAIYEGLRRFAEAESLYREVLAIWIATFGERHPDVALALNNLATTLQVQGRLGEAESLHRRALALREELLGPEHPQVATSRHNLARLRERRASRHADVRGITE